jgi:hypothetical protein
MLAFIKRFLHSIDQAARLEKIASRYAGQPERMRECMLAVIREDTGEKQATPSRRPAERFEAVTA